MDFSSKLLQSAVDEIAQLPGIGKRTALRLAIFLLRQPEIQSINLAQAIVDLRSKIKHCKNCFNITDEEVCNICNDVKRESKALCLVQDVRDVMAIESTAEYRGKYHVLGGLISPIEGIGPQDLTIEALVKRVEKEEISEIIFALSATPEGDTTSFYIYKKLMDKELQFSTIARGVSIGDELQYADEVTLGRSISNRIPLRY
ncbi:MAG: recombination protein RecR [Flavobacteriaceae bacterium]|nr:recombination protein RecR [Flavobacteriaceae bacterium]|tara:strand:+ start:2224 stop:2829 length:606 start_codon:yes stop_codon:yes gene_type:complete